MKKDYAELMCLNKDKIINLIERRKSENIMNVKALILSLIINYEDSMILMFMKS